MNNDLSYFAQQLRKQTAYSAVRVIIATLRYFVAFFCACFIIWAIAKGDYITLIDVLWRSILFYIISVVTEALLDIADCQLKAVEARHNKEESELATIESSD